MEKKLMNLIFAAYGAKDEDEFTKITGFTVAKGFSWVHNSVVIFVNFKDPFYRAQTRSTDILVKEDEIDDMIPGDAENLFKKAISYKKRQIRSLEKMRNNFYTEVRRFLARSFNIDPRIVKEDDITFNESKTFIIGGVFFRYSSTISDGSIQIEEYTYNHYKNVLSDVNNLLDYYYGKTIVDITNFKYGEDG